MLNLLLSRENCKNDFVKEYQNQNGKQCHPNRKVHAILEVVFHKLFFRCAYVCTNQNARRHREADGDHESEEAERTQNCLSRNNVNRKVARNQCKNVKRNPAPQSHKQRSKANFYLVVEILSSLFAEKANIWISVLQRIYHVNQNV